MHKCNLTVIAVLRVQGAGVTVSLSAGQTAGLFSSIGIPWGYQTQRHFWAVQVSALSGKS